MVVGPKSGTPVRGTPVSAKKRKTLLDDSDDDHDVDSPSAISPGAKLRKVNRHGLVTLMNGAVSMKALDLSESIPSKHFDSDAMPLFGARLSFGQAYALFTLVKCGHGVPAEKIRVHETRLLILMSAQPHCISDDQLCEILEASPEERLAFLHGMAKAAQQKLRYNLYGAVGNLYNERVFTKNGVQPDETVKRYLGLKDLVPQKSIMDMWVSSF